jgi:archaellum component FlaC
MSRTTSEDIEHRLGRMENDVKDVYEIVSGHTKQLARIENTVERLQDNVLRVLERHDIQEAKWISQDATNARILALLEQIAGKG